MNILTIQQTMNRIASKEAPIPFAVKEFLDGVGLQFKRGLPVIELLQDEPLVDAEQANGMTLIAGAFLAGLTEELCTVLKLEAPTWVSNDKFILEQPFFAMNTPNAQQILLIETPVYYRRRNVFAGKILTKMHKFAQEA